MFSVVPALSDAATVNWTLESSGFWDVATNWSSNPSLPGASDDAVIDVPGTNTITVRSTGGPFTVNSVTMTGDETLAIASSGSLTINSASTLNSLNQSSGTLGGTGDVTVTGAATLSGGGQTGSGTTQLQGATAITGAFTLNTGRTLQNTSTGTLTWTGGILDLDPTNTVGGGTLQNEGTFLADGANASTLRDSWGGGVINNSGTFRKQNSAANNTTTVSTLFNNTGTVAVDTGTLDLSGGGTHTGAFDVAAGAVLEFGGGTHELNTGTTFSVPATGTVQIGGGGTVNSNVNVSIGGTTEVATNSLTALNLNGTTWNTAAFTQSAGSVNGTGDLIVSGAATISGGGQTGSGTTQLQGATAITGAFTLNTGRTLQNTSTGTLTWTGGILDLDPTNTVGGGTLQNEGTFLADGANASTLRDSWGGGVINNSGTFRKQNSSSGDTTTVSTLFNNTGTVAVDTGVLSLTGGAFDNQGIVQAAGNATFGVTAGGFANHGTLKGNGTYVTPTTMALTNSGTLAPGIDAVGHLTIDGDYTQTSTGLFEVDLASLLGFDTLDVLGNGTIDGTLLIQSVGGYTPAIGDSFTIATFDDGVADASDLSGTFSNVQWVGFDPGIGFDVSYFDQSIVLNARAQVVPIPPAALLFGSGLMGLIGISRRKKAA